MSVVYWTARAEPDGRGGWVIPVPGHIVEAGLPVGEELTIVAVRPTGSTAEDMEPQDDSEGWE